MSNPKTKDELIKHKEKSIKHLDKFLTDLINSNDLKLAGKADKLSYWLKDWTEYLSFEQKFSPLSLRRYKRGEIIKIHLGFNVGSEEGGLHYAVVLDKNNAKSSPVVTVVPLTSVKPHTDISRLKAGNIFLGNELFTNLNAKISATHKHLADEVILLKKLLDNSNTPEELHDISERIDNASSELELLERMRSEVLKMKVGSIALVGQIRTISKIRIYDPKTDYDILSNIKLSNEKLDLIDKKIATMFTNI